ncbi:MAG: M23 family peptidase, partial [Nitrospira sp.]|nr:M23 family peptidase [Nitrospira sp.]
MMMTMFTQAPWRMTRLDRMMIMVAVLLSSVFPVELFPNTLPSPAGLDGQYSGKQGQVLVVKVKGEEQATEVQGKFLDRTIPFFREFRPGEPAGYVGLLGIDMQDKPGTHELAVEVKQGEQAKQLSFNVLVAKEKFAVEHLKLPKEKVDLDRKAVARWKAEQQQVKLALAETSRLKLWQSDFVEPV